MNTHLYKTRVVVRVNTNNHFTSLFKSMETGKIISNGFCFCSMETFRPVNAKHIKLYTGLNVRNMILDILRKLKNMILCGSYVFNFEFKISKFVKG